MSELARKRDRRILAADFHLQRNAWADHAELADDVLESFDPIVGFEVVRSWQIHGIEGPQDRA